MITYEDNKAPLRLNVTVRFLVVVFIRILLILPWEEAENFALKYNVLLLSVLICQLLVDLALNTTYCET